jgi:hypothetical protein
MRSGRRGLSCFRGRGCGAFALRNLYLPLHQLSGPKFFKKQTADRPKLLLIPLQAMQSQTNNSSHPAHLLLPEGNIKLHPLPRHLLCSRDSMCCLHNEEKARGLGGSHYLFFVRVRVKKRKEKLLSAQQPKNPGVTTSSSKQSSELGQQALSSHPDVPVGHWSKVVTPYPPCALTDRSRFVAVA